MSNPSACRFLKTIFTQYEIEVACCEECSDGRYIAENFSVRGEADTYQHACNKCGHKKLFLLPYPRISSLGKSEIVEAKP